MSSSKIVLDSVQPDGVRLTSIEVTLPKFVLAELNTHRAFSRNSASSRAIPVEKMIRRVVVDPVIPEFGSNRPGMQAGDVLTDAKADEALADWMSARDAAVTCATSMVSNGVHKQVANRLLEPFLFTTVLVTATARAYRHFFALRCHPMAQPEIRVAAEAMRAAMDGSTPRALDYGEWHMPYIHGEDVAQMRARLEPILVQFDSKHHDYLTMQDVVKISVARCARLSYLTQDGKRDHAADLDLFKRLRTSGHWSPFEHVARACRNAVQRDPKAGNFESGWVQLRKEMEGEYSE